MKIYNSLSRAKEVFEPINPPQVTLYACGLTPQNHPHLGHAVATIRFSLLRRYLTYRQFEVCYVENVTDIDDKIIKRSEELNLSPQEIAERYIGEYLAAKQQLEIPLPTHYPRVTEYIDKIIPYIEVLIEKGFAYPTPEGDVYFRISAKEDYGKLSGRVTTEQISGTRVVTEANKESPLDFALWKQDATPGASWKAPWGPGRPGWHIECSVMSNDLLGASIDIHCGGLDLLFPHHENEIAQCEAHNGVPFANYWVHCGLLMVDGKKMSKTLGNFLTIHDALEKYGKELITFVILRHHYRSPIDFNDQLFRDNLNALCRFYRLFDARWLEADELTYRENEETKMLIREFEAAMNDDLNTPPALVALSNYLDRAKAYADRGQLSTAEAIQQCIISLGRVLGIFQRSYDLRRIEEETLSFHQQSLGLKKPLTLDGLNALIAERRLARSVKDFQKADELRAILSDHGIRVLDGTDVVEGWQFVSRVEE